MTKMDKKGMSGLDMIPTAAITFVVAFFVLGIGAVVLSNFGTQFTANSYGANITNQGLQGINAISSQGTTLGYIVVLVVVVAALSAIYIWNRNR